MTFDEKLINVNKKVTLNKRRHFVPEKRLNGQSKSFTNIKKGYSFLLGRMYFARDDGYHSALVFA